MSNSTIEATVFATSQEDIDLLVLTSSSAIEACLLLLIALGGAIFKYKKWRGQREQREVELTHL